jgi:UDP-N-acetylglucosamine 2-epimerase (non-hydrolysing)
LLGTLIHLRGELSVIFPVHPRTRKALHTIGVAESNGHLRLLDPLPYLEFLALQRQAAFVITDSGGIQEETTFLGIPCLTVRENTERPITITQGTNQLVGRDLTRLQIAAAEILRGKPAAESTKVRIPLWDGHAAQRIARIVTSDACHQSET